jgi:hypothetical protein
MSTVDGEVELQVDLTWVDAGAVLQQLAVTVAPGDVEQEI